MLASNRISDLIRSYAEGPRLLEAAVAGIPSEELRFTPAPEHWSIHENVVHVADTDLVAAARMRYVLAQPGSTLVSFDQNKWARVLDYRSQSMEGALALLRAVRAMTSEMLTRAPVEAWEQVGINTEAGPQTLEWLVEHFAGHVHYHLRTIAKRRSQYAETRR
ncbi:MAG TPA: DinB family protein [bacterium]|nr:DinB family protein [bacterium]